MHGRKAYELVKELASGEKGHPKIFNTELFERVIEECNEHHNALQSLIRIMQDEGLEVQTARNADRYGALIHHLSLIRNKRCLMAYVYNRAEIIRDLAWKVGLLHELPSGIQEKFSDSEEQYFIDHSKSLKLYMSQLSLDVNVIAMAKVLGLSGYSTSKRSLHQGKSS
ncbi:DNA replication complex GINS protein PSF1-like isoform X2 [Durio zibethinus]|uniref:DNA replication complex GINS protein PSF1-like isoform X2 n=1 Tax=Durio zibethinus TaxID=66656 RepID=A0A6P5WFL9_DURZI|nr:DNA replication complex GINS protein PSF1-like isoform X2 [Durio zibethinus]